jgi:hypothetical protein
MMRIEISNELRERLILLREQQLTDLQAGAAGEPYPFLRQSYEELQGIDGVHLWGSIGADLYLTFDGRILLAEDRVDRQLQEKTGNLVFTAYRSLNKTGAFRKESRGLLLTP